MQKYQLTLASVENGYLVAVGCKNFVFEKQEELLKEIDAYLSGKPTKLTKKYESELKGEVGENTCVQEAPGIQSAVEKVLSDGKVRSHDLEGDSSTIEVGDEVVKKLKLSL